MTNLKKILVFLLIIAFVVQFNVATQVGQLPPGCNINSFRVIDIYWAEEQVSSRSEQAVRCQVGNSFENLDKFGNSNAAIDVYQNKTSCAIELKPAHHERKLLTKSMNFMSLMTFLGLFESCYFTVRWTNMNGFELDLFDSNAIVYDSSTSLNWLYFNSQYYHDLVYELELVNTRFDFYLGRNKKVKSCSDMLNANLLSPRTIFHISPAYGIYYVMLFRNIYKTPTCPLVFKNVRIHRLFFYGMSDSVFKTNYLRFTNDMFDSSLSNNLNTKISQVTIFNMYGVGLSVNFLNPFVFAHLHRVFAYTDVVSVEASLFKQLTRVNEFQIEALFTRHLMHKGIDWIRNINSLVKANLSDAQSVAQNIASSFYLYVRFFEYHRIGGVFPDVDFCLYKDFPFDQLVIFFMTFERDSVPDSYQMEFSCTYLYLIQYYSNLYEIFRFSTGFTANIILYNLNSNATRPQCDFEVMRRKCERTSIDEIVRPFHMFTEIAATNNIVRNLLTILGYFVYLYGLMTNAIVVIVVLSKKNRELFNNFKQYDYLCLGSVFNLLILAIQILAWFTQCSTQIDMFCPETRRWVAVQFFRIIFKEAFVETLRFMGNFAYFAFSLNRISLIGKDHNKLITFVSEVQVAYYVLVTALISVSLSIVKAFKYRVNYDRAEASYPLPFETDIWARSSWKNDAYFLATLIADFLNYVVFAVVNFGMDVFMVVKLKKTLREKMLKFRSASVVSFEKSEKDLRKVKVKQDHEDAVNKAIKMVVITNFLNILFKFSLCVDPVLNAIADFYYKDTSVMYEHPSFRMFFEKYQGSGFAALIPDSAQFFYYLSLSIQLHMFIAFDKKFKLGYLRFKSQLASRTQTAGAPSTANENNI